MNETALVIAAHGAGDGSLINRRVETIAREIEQQGIYGEVVPAFRLGSPGYGAALDRLSSSVAVVVPLMTSDGYFSRDVLPATLSQNDRYGEMEIRIARAVGSDPTLAAAARVRVGNILVQYGMAPGETTVLVVGHGTPRHSESRMATESFAAGLAGICDRVLASFLDEAPFLDDIWKDITTTNVILVPFMVGGGDHTMRDIPARMNAGLSSSRRELADAANRCVVCDIPVGEYDSISEAIVSLAKETLRARADDCRLSDDGAMREVASEVTIAAHSS